MARVHKWHSCNVEDCFVCVGGLAECTVCGGAEGWLTTECPGEHVPYEVGQQVSRGELDFVDGQWVTRHRRDSGDVL